MAWKRGQWWAVCDVCGFKYLSGQLKTRWDGMIVCEQDFETRHPQEFLRAVPETYPPWTNPEGDGINVSANEYVDALYVLPYDSTTGLPGEYTNRLGI